MKSSTWKRFAAVLMVSMTLATSPFHASASEIEATGSTVIQETLQDSAEGTTTDSVDTDTAADSTETTKTKKSKTTTTKTTKKTTSKKSYTKAELRLLSCIIYCEANAEPYAGKLAVGIVAMNRVRSGKFPNTLSGVIYQKNQFTPAGNGLLAKQLALYDKGKYTNKYQKACIKAAKAALSGTTSVTYNNKTINMKSYYFFSRYIKGSTLKICCHMFK